MTYGIRTPYGIVVQCDTPAEAVAMFEEVVRFMADDLRCALLSERAMVVTQIEAIDRVLMQLPKAVVMRKSEQVYIRLTAEQKAELTNAATHAGLSVSQWILQVALSEARKEKGGQLLDESASVT